MANTLVVETRKSDGKGPARRLRAEGKIPGVIYGHGKENVGIALNAREFGKFLDTLRSEAELVSIQVPGAQDTRLALIKDLQYHPVSEAILHVDFFEVNPDKPIHVTVPLHFVGTPVGVTDQGGMVEFLQRDLAIICLPKHIPSTIEVEISALKGNEALHVGDLKLPENVMTREDVRKSVVHVTMKVQHESGEGAPAAAAAPAAE